MRQVAFLCLLAGGCAIAFAPIFVRLTDTGPVASAFWRCRARRSAPLDVECHPREDGDRATARQRFWLDRLRGNDLAASRRGLFFAGDLGVWHWSIVWTSVANSTLLANSAPIFVTLAGWLLWRRKVTSAFLAGMFSRSPACSCSWGRTSPSAERACWATRWARSRRCSTRATSSRSRWRAMRAHRRARLMAWSTTITAIALLPVALVSPAALPALERPRLARAGGPRARHADARPRPHRLRLRAPAGFALGGDRC